MLLAALLAAWQLPSQAQARVFSQPELDALLAPVALYPDAVLSNILEAATYPDDLREAAAWSRENPHLTGEDALRAAEPMPWHPSVKALLAFPDLLARMDESPQWTADLAAAFRDQEPYVMDTVQALRQRAQANGSLQSNDQYTVQQQDSSIAIYPAQPQMVYVPYYNPYVVYGPWWWPAYRPVFWRPWYTRPTVFVSSPVFFVRSVDWHRRHVVRHVVHHHSVHHHAPAAKPIRPLPPHQAIAAEHWRREQRSPSRPQQNTPPLQPQLQWHRQLPQQQWHQQQAQVQQTQQQMRQPAPQQAPRQQQPQPQPRPQWREQRRAESQAPRVQQPALSQAVPMRQLRQIAESVRTPPQAQAQAARQAQTPLFGHRGESRHGGRGAQMQRR
jgi:hypothetical protein